MPYFSVVIPLYNKENYIAATLESVLAQTFTDFEVIVVNDVSTDNSVEVVRRFSDRRIRIVSHEINKGLSATRNTGIRNAVAEYVAFLDADDLWKPEFLEALYSLISKYPDAGLFATKYIQSYPSRRIEPQFDLPVGEAGIVEFYLSNLNQFIYYPSCLCVRKTVFEKVGYYDETITFGEDIDFNIRANCKFKLAYCNKALVSYVMDSENQITKSGISGKTVTNFDKYENLAVGRPDIKRYLDFNRYILARLYRLEGNKEGYRKMVNGIDKNSLNYKQTVLLRLPGWVLRIVGKVTNLLLKRGVVVNSYD